MKKASNDYLHTLLIILYADKLPKSFNSSTKSNLQTLGTHKFLVHTSPKLALTLGDKSLDVVQDMVQ